MSDRDDEEYEAEPDFWDQVDKEYAEKKDRDAEEFFRAQDAQD